MTTPAFQLALQAQSPNPAFVFPAIPAALPAVAQAKPNVSPVKVLC